MRHAATTMASQVRDGSRSAGEIVEVALAAALSANERINAFTSIDIEGARTRAEAIDRLVAAGRDPGPLAGVPIGLKDLIDQAGIVNTKGSNFPSPPSPSSATVVRRIGNAGGVIIGRTGTLQNSADGQSDGIGTGQIEHLAGITQHFVANRQAQ